ncbi:Glo1, partial [Symbiodinium necroappetens]
LDSSGVPLVPALIGLVGEPKVSGKELHTLDLRTGEWLTQAINERGREMPSMEEELSTARASAADAEHQAEEAQKSTQELQEFLSSPEVLAIDAIQQEVERMSFAEAYQDAFKPWALEQPEKPEEAEEAEEPEIDAEAELIWEESGFDGLDPSSSRDPRTETDMGTQSPQSPISPLSPQSAYEDLQSPDSASYQNGQIEEEASYNQEDFSPTGDPSSPQETELERSYALDDAFEEATGARNGTRLRRSLGLRSDGSLTTALMRKARSAAKRRRGAQKASTGPFTRGARVCAVCEPEKHRRFIPFSLGRIHSDG